MTGSAQSPANTQGSLDAYVDTSMDLLRTIAAVLDVRTVLPRVSEIANRILPHDALAMGFVNSGGELVVQAATADLSDLQPHVFDTSFPDDVIIGDQTAEELPVARGTTNPTPWLVARGYRSLLTTATRTGDRVVGARFWSKHPHAYERAHLPLAVTSSTTWPSLSRMNSWRPLTSLHFALASREQ